MADVSVSVGAELSELRQGLNEAGEMTEGFVHKAHGAHRAARFFAEGIGAITGEAGGAERAISSMLGGFAAGGVGGLAIGAVNALLEGLKETRKEAEKGIEAKELKDIEKAAKDARKELEHLLYVKEGHTEADWKAKEAEEGPEAQKAALEKKLADLKADTLAKQKLLNEAEAQGYDTRPWTAAIAANDRLALQYEAQVKHLNEVIKAHEDLRTERNREGADKKGGKDDKAAEREAEQALKASLARTERLAHETAELNAQGLSKEEAAYRQHLERVRQLQAALEEAKKSGFKAEVQAAQAAIAAEDSAYARQVEKDKAEEQKAAAAWLAANKTKTDQAWAEEQRRQDGIRHIREAAAKEEVRQQKEQTKHLVQEMKPIARAGAQVFGDIARDGKVSSQTLKNALGSLADAAINYFGKMAEEWVAGELTKTLASKTAATQEAQGEVGVMANKAYSAMADIPYVGPALAAAAAAQATAYGEANVALASAAGGWDVPWQVGNAGYPTMVHGGEKVTDAQRSARLDRLMDNVEAMQSGGSGGPKYVFNGPVYHASGVKALLDSDPRGVQQHFQEQRGLGRKV